MVGPVPVGADPDLEEHGLALDDGQVARGGERLDALPGPDEREGERELDVVAGRALAVDVALPDRGHLRLLHPGLEPAPDVMHRLAGDLVRDADPRDLLLGLDRAGAGEDGRAVDGVRETRRTTRA